MRLPSYIRASGDLRLRFRAIGDRTRLVERADGGGFLIRSLGGAAAPCCEAVLLNTGGGMAGGDRLSVTAEALPGTQATITTQAAEKIYRSDGATTRIDVALTLGAGSRLDWVPQETILFEGSRLQRQLAAELAGDAVLTIGEALIFGRIAMAEEMATGALHDRWRIRRGGRLIFAEDVALPDRPAERLAARAAGQGARAVAVILHAAPGAEARLAEARARIEGGVVEAAATAWDGMLLLRLLSPDAQALRAEFAALLAWLRGRSLPRCW